MFNAKAVTDDLNLSLDIDPKREVINEFFFEGSASQHFQSEMEELKILSLGKTLEEVRAISRSQLKSETKLSNGQPALAAKGLWLLKKAIDSYVGHGRFYKAQPDMLCLCFSVTKREIVKKVLENKNFELKTLIQDTMASSACGSCRMPIEKLIRDTRNEHGLIKGLDHSQSRFDEKGQWLRVAGLYPGPLLIKLDELKNNWMKREGIIGQFEIEFTNIEGLHLSVEINSTNEKTVQGLLLALTDYLKSELGVLFFLKSSVTSFSL